VLGAGSAEERDATEEGEGGDPGTSIVHYRRYGKYRPNTCPTAIVPHPLLVQKYLLYLYISTNTDAEVMWIGMMLS
jgi:hypothetical protein